MNYLAHAYLSFKTPGILTGNMISDYVKGKKKFDYPDLIQKGITLHRLIDEFTDTHPATHGAKKFFSPAYRLYSGAFVDVAYDHFLANDQLEFATDENLQSFGVTTYSMLEKDEAILPPRFQQMLPYMKQQNWLFNYKFTTGIERSFEGVVRRAAYLSESAMAYKIFIDNYDDLSTCYNNFFSHLKQFAHQQLDKLVNS